MNCFFDKSCYKSYCSKCIKTTLTPHHFNWEALNCNIAKNKGSNQVKLAIHYPFSHRKRHSESMFQKYELNLNHLSVLYGFWYPTNLLKYVVQFRLLYLTAQISFKYNSVRIINWVNILSFSLNRWSHTGQIGEVGLLFLAVKFERC